MYFLDYMYWYEYVQMSVGVFRVRRGWSWSWRQLPLILYGYLDLKWSLGRPLHLSSPYNHISENIRNSFQKKSKAMTMLKIYKARCLVEPSSMFYLVTILVITRLIIL